MKTGYSAAINLAEEKLRTRDAGKTAARTGVRLEDGKYQIPWFGQWSDLASGRDTERILWLHYLISDGVRKPKGEPAAFREFPCAGFYETKFIQRAVKPLVKRFGDCPEQLLAAGERLGGETASFGDAAVKINLLPHIPVIYIIWRGDGELPNEGGILFDKTAGDWLPAEDLTVIASLGTYKLISL